MFSKVTIISIDSVFLEFQSALTNKKHIHDYKCYHLAKQLK